MSETSIPEAPEFQMRYTSREGFEQLLLAIRNGANITINGLLVEKVCGERHHGLVIDELRDVAHAAEIALAMLDYGYYPKSGAVDTARAVIDHYDLLTHDPEMAAKPRIEGARA